MDSMPPTDDAKLWGNDGRPGRRTAIRASRQEAVGLDLHLNLPQRAQRPLGHVPTADGMIVMGAVDGQRRRGGKLEQWSERAP